MLIDVTKNETTGKYEVETDVKPTPAPGGGAIAYAWNYEDDFGGTGITYFNFDIAPDTKEEYLTKKTIEFNSTIVYIYSIESIINGYSKQSDTQFYISEGRSGYTYTRADSSNDVDIWTYDPNGGGGEEEIEPPFDEPGLGGKG